MVVLVRRYFVFLFAIASAVTGNQLLVRIEGKSAVFKPGGFLANPG